MSEAVAAAASVRRICLEAPHLASIIFLMFSGKIDFAGPTLWAVTWGIWLTL